MEQIKRALLGLNIGAAQKVFMYAVLKDVVPASYIDIYINSADKNNVFNFFGKAELIVAEVNIFGGEQHVARIAFSKKAEIACQLAEALESHMEAKASQLMGEPDSLYHSQAIILNRRAYPEDLKGNPLVRFRLTKGGMEEQTNYVRALMKDLLYLRMYTHLC